MISSSSDTASTRETPVAARPRVRGGDDDIAGGELHRRTRQQRGITLQQIAQSTKIPLRHLEALEQDDLATLPAGMYRRAHARAYAAAVGLDPRVAMARLDRPLDEMTPPKAPDVPPSAPSASSASGSTPGAIAAGLAVMVVVIALAIWARPPASSDVTSSAGTDSSSASSVVAAQGSPTYVPAAAGSVERASVAATANTEPAAPAPVTTVEPQTELAGATADAPPTFEPQLAVVTEPGGARVTVDGIGWGVTPLTIRYLTPGSKRVRVTLDGYRSEERVVQLDGSRAKTTIRILMRNQN
jgi:cytoskeletal protein RodZ